MTIASSSVGVRSRPYLRTGTTLLPGLGGRIHSLHHKPTGRELLCTNPVLQPADFALNGAWFSGGIVEHRRDRPHHPVLRPGARCPCPRPRRR